MLATRCLLHIGAPPPTGEVSQDIDTGCAPSLSRPGHGENSPAPTPPRICGILAARRAPGPPESRICGVVEGSAAEERELDAADLGLVHEHAPPDRELLALDAREGGAEERVALHLVRLQRQPPAAVADLGDQRPGSPPGARVALPDDEVLVALDGLDHLDEGLVGRAGEEVRERLDNDDGPHPALRRRFLEVPD